MKWSMKTGVKLIDSWDQHGTISTSPLSPNWLHQSSWQRTTLHARRWRIWKKGRERKPQVRNEKKIYTLDSGHIHKRTFRKRTTVQHNLAQNEARIQSRKVQLLSSSITTGTLACMRKCNLAIKPKTSTSETPVTLSSPSGTRFPHPFHNHQTKEDGVHAHRTPHSDKIQRISVT